MLIMIYMLDDWTDPASLYILITDCYMVYHIVGYF